MTSSNGSIFRITGPLWGESTGHIPLTKASDAELWCFLTSTPEQTVEHTLETPVTWNAFALIKTSLQCIKVFSAGISTTKYAYEGNNTLTFVQ